MDLTMCSKRNIHNRTEEDIGNIIKNWEETPRHYLRVDVRSLLQSVAITEVSIVMSCPEHFDLTDRQDEQRIEYII